MKHKGVFASSLLLSLCLSGCGSEEPMVTEVYPPKLTFATPEGTEVFFEDWEEKQEQTVATNGTERYQVVPEYPMVSSFLDPWEQESYHAYSTMDGDETTAWVENATGLGAGEWVQHSYAWPTSIQEINFYNGHGGNFTEFGHAEKIQLSFSDGTEFTYNAGKGWNTIVLDSPKMTTYVRLTILQGTAGTREDVAISEMRIYNVSADKATTPISKAEILSSMGALGNCSNITPEQAKAFAFELQKVMAWAESNAAIRRNLGEGYDEYTGEALLFEGSDGVPVLYYDYDFVKVDELFLTKTDVAVWDGTEAHGGYFETMGEDTMVNWVLPGLVYEKAGRYYFGLTEYDLYGSGSFGLIAMVPFERGMPASDASYVSFISHKTTGAYSYASELDDYLKVSVLRNYPTYQLAELITAGEEEYFEFNGSEFVNKNLFWDPTNYSTWFNAIRTARTDAGYEQVTRIQSGETVLAGLLALS